MAYKSLERLISAINVEEAAPRRNKNCKEKAKTAHKNVTLRNVVSNLRHSVVTPEHLAQILNIGLEKAKKMLRVTNKRGIRTIVHPISRR